MYSSDKPSPNNLIYGKLSTQRRIPLFRVYVVYNYGGVHLVGSIGSISPL